MVWKTYIQGLISFSLASVLALTSCGPMGGDVPEENLGISQEPLFTIDTCSSATNLAGSKDALRWSAPVSALPALERGFKWINQAQYSQTQSCNVSPGVCCNGACGNPSTAYRTDCSGFVSLSWGLNAEPTTATLPGYG